jgi:hypothetical protein
MSFRRQIKSASAQARKQEKEAYEQSYIAEAVESDDARGRVKEYDFR